MPVIFKLAKDIENQIDGFLILVYESGLIFKMAINEYLNNDIISFNKNIAKVTDYERKADELRSEVEKQLYLKTLIPDNRGDVLDILENTDNVIDAMKSTLSSFSVETPKIPPQLNLMYNKLTKSSIESVEWLIKAINSFFREMKTVNCFIDKVTEFEKITDDIAIQLKTEIFEQQFDLSEKMQLRYFADNIEKISDYAEIVGDKLAIYTIKRLV